MPNSLSRKNIWAALPRDVRGTVGRVLAVLPNPWLLGARFRRTLAFLEAAQWWPRERAIEFQLATLRALCAQAATGSAYYKRVFREARFDPRDLTSLEALRQLPFIDRHTIRDHVDEMRLAGATSLRVDTVSTGGTGGVPLQFYIGAGRSSVEYAYLCAGWRRAGFRPGVPLAVFRGRPVPPDRTGLRHQYDGILRHHYYSVFDLSEQSMARYLAHVATIGPCYLHVYPSSAAALARFLLRSRRGPLPNVQGILTESEILYPSQRRLIERAFGRGCFSSYGQTEKVVAATGCEGSVDYHVWPTYGVFELIDSEGRPVTTPGERGEIVGTSFLNEVVPFIRYRTGDFATYVAERCRSCGREHTVLADIRGHRTQECLVAFDGTRISWTAINVHDDTFVRVRQLQFVQHRPGYAVLHVVPGAGYQAADSDRIKARLRAKLENRVTIDVVTVDRIVLSPAGKAIFVDQRIPGVVGEDDHTDAQPAALAYTGTGS